MFDEKVRSSEKAIRKLKETTKSFTAETALKAAKDALIDIDVFQMKIRETQKKLEKGVAAGLPISEKFKLEHYLESLRQLERVEQERYSAAIQQFDALKTLDEKQQVIADRNKADYQRKLGQEEALRNSKEVTAQQFKTDQAIFKSILDKETAGFKLASEKRIALMHFQRKTSKEIAIQTRDDAITIATQIRDKERDLMLWKTAKDQQEKPWLSLKGLRDVETIPIDKRFDDATNKAKASFEKTGIQGLVRQRKFAEEAQDIAIKAENIKNANILQSQEMAMARRIELMKRMNGEK